MSTVPGPDGHPRCSWCSVTPEYFRYHDEEWGYPVTDDQRLFEKLCLESFQSGLSWRTILSKRENFRAAFDQFDFRKMASYDQKDVERLLNDAGIVRHRGKIEAVINNAQRAIELIEQEGSIAAFFWQFEPEERPADADVRSTCEESTQLSKALKKRGWKFVGPTTVYSLMQAMGMVNDHDKSCAFRKIIDEARRGFSRPPCATNQDF
ncbi:MAG: DNA-3-methyladenine glycosylase I [Oceanobacter sp.]